MESEHDGRDAAPEGEPEAPVPGPEASRPGEGWDAHQARPPATPGEPPAGQALAGQAPAGERPTGESPAGGVYPGPPPYGGGAWPVGGAGQPYGGTWLGGSAGRPYGGTWPSGGGWPGGSAGRSYGGAWPGAGAGQPDGGGPPGENVPAEASLSRPRPRGRTALLGGLAVVLVLAASLAGWLIGRSSPRSGSGKQAARTAAQPIPSPSKGGTGSRLNVATLAANLDPAVVDITSFDATSGEEAAGTGMVLTASGEVLTNNHVIADATTITAQIDGKGRTYAVDVLGADVSQDVALVQLVGASGLHTVSIGNSSSLQIGDPVVAIGNALDLKGPPTVTEGIVSALDRSISASDAATGLTENLSGLIQTDAPINPGNSGGPLVDAAGQVIGMDTAAADGSSEQPATNIGFAIPIDEAIGIAQQIQEGRAGSAVAIDRGGFIGVEVVSVAEAEDSGGIFGPQFPTPGTSKGAYVAAVLPDTPAHTAGLEEGDVIVAVGGLAVSSPHDLGSILLRYSPGQSVTVTWVDPRGGRHTASVTLVARPAA